MNHAGPATTVIVFVIIIVTVSIIDVIHVVFTILIAIVVVIVLFIIVLLSCTIIIYFIDDAVPAMHRDATFMSLEAQTCNTMQHVCLKHTEPALYTSLQPGTCERYVWLSGLAYAVADSQRLCHL